MAPVTLFLVESHRMKLRRGAVVSISCNGDAPDQKRHDTSAGGQLDVDIPEVIGGRQGMNLAATFGREGG